MKVLKILLYILLGVIALWMILGIFATKDYHIERSIAIDAPKDLVYDQVRHFKNFENWSPWAAIDPAMKVSVEGTDGEVGAVYKWAGNDDVGSGRQTITALQPDRIDIDVQFTEPFETQSPTHFSFREDSAGTNVVWAFEMHVPFPWNGLVMFTDVDAGVGKDYALGLENLKKVCEAIVHKKYRGYEVAVVDMPERYYAGVRKTVSFTDMPAFFDTNLKKALELVQKSGDSLSGAPCGLYWSYDEQAGTSDMAAAVPVSSEQPPARGLQVFKVGGRKAFVIDYFGAYEKSGEAHYAMDDYMTEKGLQNVPPMIEEYITGPAQEPDTSKWFTRIIYFAEPKPNPETPPGD